MNVQRVLVMKQNSLLNQALTALLKRADCEFQVIKSRANEPTSLIAETSKLKPDIVILGEANSLAREDTVGHLLILNEKIKVVIVSEDTNWIHIFHKKDMLMTQQTDLLDALCVG